jgi:hypothetical protein
MEDDARLEVARRVASEARAAARIPGQQPLGTSRENEGFVGDYFAASRLHFIGTWKTRFVQLLEALPPPPPLPIANERVIAHIDMDCFFVVAQSRTTARCSRTHEPQPVRDRDFASRCRHQWLRATTRS